MASPKRLHAAVIGTGFVGPHHVDAIRRAGYAEVDVVVGSNPERTRARAESLAVGRWTTDVASVMSDPAIDVVHVCTPNNTHLALGSAVLEAGKHLVLEKPIATSRADADALVALAGRSGSHAMVALTYRGYPMIQRARAIVAAGEVGDIRLVHGGYIQDWLADRTDFNWRIEPEVGGPSRAVADIGSHWFDTAEFIGGTRIEAVLADFATLLPERIRPAGGTAAFSAATGRGKPVRIGSEDVATILLRFVGGARGACVISQVSTGRKNAFTLDVDGSAASMSWSQEDPERLWLRTRRTASLLSRDPEGRQPSAGVPWLPAGHPEGWGEALRDLLRPFYAAVADGASPESDSQDYPSLAVGARGVAFVDAAIKSAASGGWASLPA